MHDLKWSAAEKRITRRVFEAALEAELAEIMSEFKARVAAAAEPEDMWSLEEYLQHKRLGIHRKYDYRYRQLLFVFAQLLHQRRIRIEQLGWLSGDRLSYLRRMASS